jgi:hypothetical protein
MRAHRRAFLTARSSRRREIANGLLAAAVFGRPLLDQLAGNVGPRVMGPARGRTMQPLARSETDAEACSWALLNSAFQPASYCSFSSSETRPCVNNVLLSVS